MLPSSSSHVARYGHINHCKKFWLLQTQLEKQEQPSTALSLGVTGSANVKENARPLISSSALLVNGDHLSNSTAGHGSCRGEMVSSAPSSSGSRAGANFPYCSSELSSSKLYGNGRLGYTHVQSNGSLRHDSSPLSLAVNCEGVTHPSINFLDQSWVPAASSACQTASELQLRDSSSAVSRVQSSCISLVKESSCGEESDPSIPSSHQEAAVLPCSFKSGHGYNGPLRICSLCGTSKTPLWRSGPAGPKSLCNACGIRVKKTKRLQAAMEAAGDGAETIIRSASSPAGAYKRLLAAAAAAAATTSKAAGRVGATQKRKLSMEAADNQSDPFLQSKKKKKAAERRSSSCSWPPPNLGGGSYRNFGESHAILAADNSSSRKVSNLLGNAQDVEEAAVLLMALSCGLVLS